MAEKKKPQQGGKKATPSPKQKGDELSMDDLKKVSGGLARKGRTTKKGT